MKKVIHIRKKSTGNIIKKKLHTALYLMLLLAMEAAEVQSVVLIRELRAMVMLDTLNIVLEICLEIIR
jgi:hypothetical protein